MRRRAERIEGEGGEMTVWKFVLDPNGCVMMPRGARILSVGEQGAEIVAWAMVDPKASTVRRRIVPIGTGHKAEHVAALSFVGTVQMRDGLVFHFFDAGEP